jgi:hypothetical protein
MWAQGLTVGMVLVAGILTHANQQEAAARTVRSLSLIIMHGISDPSSQKSTDHSWAAIVSRIL